MFSEPEPTPAEPLAAARARSIERAARLVGAARDLANERHSAGFTVHEVAARAGSSLKGFYRCFAGKDDLLVALLAEDSRMGAAILGERVDAEAAHGDRIRTCVTAFFELSTLPGAEGYARVLVSEHRRLSQERPGDLRAALAPIVDVIARVVDDATRAGVAESASPSRDAETVFSLILDGLHDTALGTVAPDDQAEYLWRFCGRALRVPDADTVRTAEPRSSTTPGRNP